MMCRCVNVEVGSYDNQVVLIPPSWSSHMTICVDRCLWEEIVNLWYIGIQTTGCCCGHKKGHPYIGVIDSDIPRMKQMGYQVHPNPCRPNDEDSFYPKSV